MLFSFVIVGCKLVFSLLFFMLPKMITQDDGENAPFGMYMSAAPLSIILFVLFLAPVHALYQPYDLILVGTLIGTFAPLPMFMGLNMINFMLFILIVSFAEALYSPMVNVFTFNFTTEGREGTFLTLTAAPVYFTMALTGIIGGYLLENFYPAQEDASRKRQPDVIWITIIACSAVSTFALYMGRDYFNVKPEEINVSMDLTEQDLSDIAKAKAKNLEDIANEAPRDRNINTEEATPGILSGYKAVNRSQQDIRRSAIRGQIHSGSPSISAQSAETNSLEEANRE